LVVTAEVEAVNVAEEDPAPMLTFAGTVAAALLLDAATVIPPAGAGPEMLTVQVLEAPPATVAGAHRIEDRVMLGGATGAVTVRSAVTWPLL
jgi:hypothetical protein